MGKAIFFDRDNTLVEDPGYLRDPEKVKLLPGVGAALRRLAEAGYKLVVVTNQNAIAKGLLAEEILGLIHGRLRDLLGEFGVGLAAIYYCPFHPEAKVAAYRRQSDERKPAPGMLLRAARELGLDLAQSWMVGDSPRDVEAGRRAGCRTIHLVHADRPAMHPDEPSSPDFVVSTIEQAVDVILRGGN